MKRLVLATVWSTALLLTSSASAAQPPSLLSVSTQNRHPTATFSVPGADDGTIYIASGPERATDGSFLQENLKYLDFFTADELQSGTWLSESQLDPGTYYVMLKATDYDCYGNPTCLDGYSNMLTLTVPEPTHAYRGSVQVLHYSHVVYLGFRVTQLGRALPYKVCWRLKNRTRRCVSGKVSGYSWNDSAESSLTVRLKGMNRRTVFTWYVAGRQVASKNANTVRL